jgi:enterochelin esterase-like enzyme
VLGEDRRILIYLPPGYDDSPQRRYPVMYMLHGYGGYTQPVPEWEEWGLKDQAESLTLSGQIQPMIVVQPDGFMPDGQPSYFFNHAPASDGKRWGDYVWQDVVNYTDTNYRTLPRRESRAVGGFSLGGQAALSLSLLHPEIFKVVGAHSPSFRSADGSIPFFGDWNYYNQYDPFWLVQNTDTARQLAIWIDVGADDDKWRNCSPDQKCIESFHALLVARGIPHDWHDDWPGKHEGPSYWSVHVSDYLVWYASKLVGQ